jgi:transposase
MRYPDGGGLTAKQRAQRERVRFEAAEMFAAGGTPPQIARRLRVSRKSAYAWHAAWRAGGADALHSKGPSGHPSRMKPSWRAWLEQALEEGPAAHGWVEDQRWTLTRVAILVARRFHVRFSEPQMSRILHQMGFSVQVPVHRAAERDENAVVSWRKEIWPRVGKQ